MTTAFLIFFALALEYIYDPISNMKDTFVIDSAFSKYQNQIKDYKFDKITVLMLFPIMVILIFTIIDYFLYNFIHPFFSFLLGLIALLYCLKPSEFNQKLENLKFAIENNKDLDESKRFEYILFVEKNEGPISIISNIFYNSIRNIFSVIFVFLLLGPSGCLAYVILDNYIYSDKIKVDKKSKKFIKLVISFIEYLPVRICAFTFAVVANFELCMNKWRTLKVQKEFYVSNINLINSVGIASFGNEDGEKENNENEMITYAQSIISRSLLAWLSIVGFLIISGVFM